MHGFQAFNNDGHFGQLLLRIRPVGVHTAHDIQNVLAHDQIGRREDMTAYQRPLALLDAGIVVVQFLLVLGKRVPSVGNRGYAQADHETGVCLGIAHEVAMQSAFLEREIE